MSIVSSTLSELEDEGQVFVSKLEGEIDEFHRLFVSPPLSVEGEEGR